MRKYFLTIIACTFVSFSGIPAQADGFFFGFSNNNARTAYYHSPRRSRHILSPRQIRRTLQRKGYRYIRSIHRRGNDYIAVASKRNRRGVYRQYRLRLDGREGIIERRWPIRRR